MKLLEKKTDVFNFKPYNDGVLYVDKSEPKASKLVFENEDTKLTFEQFDVGNYWLRWNNNNGFINCLAKEGLKEDYRTVLLNKNFEIVKKFYKNDIVIGCKHSYYFSNGNNGSGIASLNNDELILKYEENPSGRGLADFNESYLVEGITDSGLLFIKKFSDKSTIRVNIFQILGIPLNDDKHFKFAHIYGHRLLLFVGFYLVIVNCETGEIVHFLDFKTDFRTFIVHGNNVYMQDENFLIKCIFKEDALEEQYFEKLVPSEDKKLYLHVIQSMVLDGDNLWALSRNSTPPFLVKIDAATGKRIQAIDLRTFGIKEAREVSVTANKIYITNYGTTAWVFQKEADET